ncbi:ABC transporter ATP-binding protein, partial [Frankia nepalensis]|uniref:ABC transporter ATP-binding protein n=1 Tax=Frankia nepalensis TaxID=1836974 RepID=UPI0019349B4E
MPAETVSAEIVSAEIAPVLEARGLFAGYRRIPCVRDVSLDVRPGEIVVVLGPNGAGKTTTLLTLAGALPGLGGEVLWRGSPTTASLHRRVRAGLGVIPEERSVISRLSTHDNLRIGPGPVERALDLFPELRPLLRRRAGLLSGGEQRMLLTARALAAEPTVLLADELSLGLAPKIVARLMQALRAAADRGAGGGGGGGRPPPPAARAGPGG